MACAIVAYARKNKGDRYRYVVLSTQSCSDIIGLVLVLPVHGSDIFNVLIFMSSRGH